MQLMLAMLDLLGADCEMLEGKSRAGLHGRNARLERSMAVLHDLDAMFICCLQAHKPMLTFQLHFLYDVLYIIWHVRGVYSEHFAKLFLPSPAPAATSPTQAPPPPVQMQSSTDASIERALPAATSAVHAAGSAASPTHAAQAQHSIPEVATGAVQPQRPLKTMAVDLPFELQVTFASFSSLHCTLNTYGLFCRGVFRSHVKAKNKRIAFLERAGSRSTMVPSLCGVQYNKNLFKHISEVSCE